MALPYARKDLAGSTNDHDFGMTFVIPGSPSDCIGPRDRELAIGSRASGGKARLSRNDS